MPTTAYPLHLRLQHELSPLLSPLGKAYGALMRWRAALYAKDRLPRFIPQAPCISVGNIAWGGTGKTPLCGWLLKWASGQGLTSVLLTRGYGAKPPRHPFVVRPDSNPAQAGDEPLLLARTCCAGRDSGCHVVVDPSRRRSGRFAWDRWRPDMFILDDGFQHLAVGRHVNLVLLKPQDLLREWNRVIPAGSWREDVSALGRASAFVLKMGADEFEAGRKRIEERLGPFSRPVFSVGLRPTGVRPARLAPDGPDEDRTWPDDEPYLLVTGVGEPAQFIETATAFLGHPPEKSLVFPDHRPYTTADAQAIRIEASKAGCRAILCTAKDAVKLALYDFPDLWSLEVEPTFGPFMFSDAPFPAWLGSEIERVKTAIQSA